jgi:hypothetical protein
MDITAIADAVVAALTPFLPLLRRLGEGAVDHSLDEIGNRIDTKGWDLAKDLWRRLRDRVASDPILQQTTDALATVPADPAAQDGMRQQLQRLLTNDPALLTDLQQLLTAKAVAQQTNIANELNIGVQAGSISGGKVKGVGKQAPPADDS